MRGLAEFCYWHKGDFSEKKNFDFLFFFSTSFCNRLDSQKKRLIMSTEPCSHLVNLDIGSILKERLASQKTQRLQCQGKHNSSQKAKEGYN